MKCDTAREKIYIGSTWLSRWRASLHMRLCGSCKQWQREQEAMSALLEQLPEFEVPAELSKAIEESIPVEAVTKEERKVPQSFDIETLGRRNRRIGWAFGLATMGVVAALGAAIFLLNRGSEDIVKRPRIEPEPGEAVYASLVLPEDFDDGTPFEGKIIALIEPEEDVLRPELRPLGKALGHMLLSDLAADPAIRVVSRERVAESLAEFRMTKLGLVEPKTAQHLGQAVKADTLVSLLIGNGEDEIRVALQLHSPKTGKTAWSKQFIGPKSALPEIEREMVTVLRERLGIEALAPQPPKRGEPATLAIFDFVPAGTAVMLDKHAADLADLLAYFVSTEGSVRLVERRQLATLLKEQELVFTSLDEVDQEQMGRILGAQRFLNTTMVQWEDQVRFDAHLVDPETGVIAASLWVEGKASEAPELLSELARQVILGLTISGDVKLEVAESTVDLPVEAAVHYARGRELMLAADYAKAKEEFEKAHYVEPEYFDALWMLIMASYLNEDYDEGAAYAKGYLEEHPENPDDIPWRLAEIEKARGNWKEMEAAARVMLADDTFEWIAKEASTAEFLIEALLKQDRWQEAIDHCKQVNRRADDYNIRATWSYMLALMSYDIADRVWYKKGAMPPDFLGLMRQIVDAIPTDIEGMDVRIAGPLSWNINTYCLWLPAPDNRLYESPAQELEKGLQLTEYAQKRFRKYRLTSAMMGISRGLMLARMERTEEALAAFEEVLEKYPEVDIDNYMWSKFERPTNGRVYFYIGLIQEQKGDKAEAEEAYRKVVEIMNPSYREAQYALGRLKEWKAELPERAEREKRIYGLPALDWRRGQRFADWLRSHDYQLWGERYDGEKPNLGEAGTLVLTYEGGMQPSYAAEDLRSWVAHGGRLLLLCKGFTHSTGWGGGVTPRSESIDPTLNWILYAFDMGMDATGGWSSSVGNAQRVETAGHALTKKTKAFDYEGDWWPLKCKEEEVLLRIGGEKSGEGAVVAAAKQVGLGRVAVVTLRDWHLSGGIRATRGGPTPQREIGEWENTLMADVMNWLTMPQKFREDRKLVERLSTGWFTYSTGYYLYAASDFKWATEESVPVAEETRYLTARLVSSYEDESAPETKAAYKDFYEMARRAKDPWIRRSSAYWACRVATQAGDARTAQKYYKLVAEMHGDTLWAKATVQMGNLWIWKRDYKKAEKYFREVAGEMPRSEEKIRALFGLAYTLERQKRLDEAVRLYEVIGEEYGGVRLSHSVEYYWSDPWEEYWPVESRECKEEEDHRLKEAVEYRLAEIEKARSGVEESKEEKGLRESLKSIFERLTKHSQSAGETGM